MIGKKYKTSQKPETTPIVCARFACKILRFNIKLFYPVAMYFISSVSAPTKIIISKSAVPSVGSETTKRKSSTKQSGPGPLSLSSVSKESSEAVWTESNSTPGSSTKTTNQSQSGSTGDSSASKCGGSRIKLVIKYAEIMKNTKI